MFKKKDFIAGGKKISRHERYFRWAVLITFLLLMLLTALQVLKQIKMRSMDIGQEVGEVEKLRKNGYVIAAVQEIRKWPDDIFWRAWPFLEKQASQYQPIFYYEYARRFWQDKKTDKAFFWAAIGHFRGLYDTSRCSQETIAEEWRSYWETVFLPEEIYEATFRSHNQLQDVLQKVLDWDAKNPAYRAPVYLCAFVEQPRLSRQIFIPKEQWPFIYRQLRLSTIQGTKLPD